MLRQVEEASGERAKGALRMGRCRLHVFYSGQVQGVGFRYTVRTVAQGFEVTGLVRNLLDGRVELVAEGAREELEAFRQAIGDSGLGGLIRHEEVSWETPQGNLRGFGIAG
jgi:acylphosphatase